MFNRRKRISDISQSDILSAEVESAQDEQEWEEFVPSVEQKKENDGGLRFRVSEQDATAVTDDETKPLDEEDDLLDIASFPALRMAYGLDRPESAYMPVFSYEEELGEEEIRQRLIEKFAEEADEEMAEQFKEPVGELPTLFRTEPKVEPMEEETLSEEPEEFTMESEIAKQREISGELFDYIGVIEKDARDLIFQREQDQVKAREPKTYDPYNVQFNSRYDDTEKVLEETPEIPIKPKFKMEG